MKFDPLQTRDWKNPKAMPIWVLCDAPRVNSHQVTVHQAEIRMSTARFHPDQKLFSGAFAVMTEALAHLPRAARPAPAARAPRLGFWDRVDAWYWRCQQRDREAYLAGAQSIAEIENRIRELDRDPPRYV
jgi:hypothetical protein